MTDAGSGEAVAQPPATSGKRAVLATVPSDAHMWNLVYIELLLKEKGWDVLNLGACSPAELVVETCLAEKPDMLVVSTVNGHGHIGGSKLIGQVRAQPDLDYLPCVIGGKLGTLGADNAVFGDGLVKAGYSAVFIESAGLPEFAQFIRAPKRAELTA